jgi:hypothetical protein
MAISFSIVYASKDGFMVRSITSSANLAESAAAAVTASARVSILALDTRLQQTGS